jgi:hypothetical protein
MEATATNATPVTERIKTWADVLAANNLTQGAFDQQWHGRPDYDIATEQCRLIALALNEGTTMKTADTDQWKYFPWFEVVPDVTKAAGFGLSYGGCDNSYTYAYLGARLAFKTWELAEYAGKTFTDIYERALV